MTARTWDLPDEPEIGTRVRDKAGRQWSRRDSVMWGRTDPEDGTRLTWNSLVVSYGPLTEDPAAALPIEDGALIIASGVVGDSRVAFTRATLVRTPSGSWWGASATVDRGIIFLPNVDDLTSWTEAVAVPRHALDALREALNNSSGQEIDSAAEAILDAVDGAS